MLISVGGSAERLSCFVVNVANSQAFSLSSSIDQWDNMDSFVSRRRRSLSYISETGRLLAKGALIGFPSPGSVAGTWDSLIESFKEIQPFTMLSISRTVW